MGGGRPGARAGGVSVAVLTTGGGSQGRRACWRSLSRCSDTGGGSPKRCRSATGRRRSSLVDSPGQPAADSTADRPSERGQPDAEHAQNHHRGDEGGHHEPRRPRERRRRGEAVGEYPADSESPDQSGAESDAAALSRPPLCEIPSEEATEEHRPERHLGAGLPVREGRERGDGTPPNRAYVHLSPSRPWREPVRVTSVRLGRVEQIQPASRHDARSNPTHIVKRSLPSRPCSGTCASSSSAQATQA